ncbi:MAG: chorismate synthase [Deltaproteobacteria bacterium HGW-Deltaproteobacteria-19]|nr:MAG: chorismate synthase [Deltaproteobacteria bacterium HGW-Deltaproteobacteria-19]
MAGNTFGVAFCVTTWGESHGPALGAVVDGCPPGLELDERDVQEWLDRRRPGRVRSSSPRREDDRVEILSGVFEGKTTGTPIALLIRNRDAASVDYEDLRNVFRPGHGDYTYSKKYGLRDHRGGGRASGRETVARVAAGAVAAKILAARGVRVYAFTRELGGVVATDIRLREMDRNDLRCPDPQAAFRMAERLEEARKDGDSLGGVVEIVVQGCPPGLGEPVFDKLDADLAKALMGIGTVKGVEIGAGFDAARMAGSQCNDALGPDGFRTNRAGGILAGISSGQDIVLRAACKPIPSIGKGQETVDVSGNPVQLAVRGRHDVCVIPRILPVCEAMVSIVLADHLLRQRAIEG